MTRPVPPAPARSHRRTYRPARWRTGCPPPTGRRSRPSSRRRRPDTFATRSCRDGRTARRPQSRRSRAPGRLRAHQSSCRRSQPRERGSAPAWGWHRPTSRHTPAEGALGPGRVCCARRRTCRCRCSHLRRCQGRLVRSSRVRAQSPAASISAPALRSSSPVSPCGPEGSARGYRCRSARGKSQEQRSGW